jgi:hypothetical protein
MNLKSQFLKACCVAISCSLILLGVGCTSEPEELDQGICYDPADCPELAEAEPTQPSGGDIVRLGHFYVSGGDISTPTEFQVHHVIHLKFGFKPTDPTHNDKIFVGLVEEQESGAEHGQATSCRLGNWTATYTQDDVNEEGYILIERDFIIPDKCLDDGNGGQVASRTFNLWVSQNPVQREIDPSCAVGGKDDVACSIYYTLGDDGITQVKHTKYDYNAQFFNDEDIDMDQIEAGQTNRNDLCSHISDPTKDCIASITVVPSSGLDFSVADLSLHTDIAETNPTNCDQPNALLETTVHIELHGESSYDNNTQAEVPTNILTDKTLSVNYELCPAKLDENGIPATDCKDGADFVGLKIGTENVDPDGHTVLADSTDITVLYSNEQKQHPESLYESTALCNTMNGDWKDATFFILKACVSADNLVESNPCTTGEGCTPAQATSANNCRTQLVEVRRAAPTSFDGANSTSLNWSWEKQQGGSVVNANIDLGTSNTANLGGAATANWAKADVGGWIGFSIFNVAANAGAYVSIVGSYYNYEVSVLGTTYYSDSSEIAEVSVSNYPKYTKSYTASYNYGIAGIGLNASFSVTGEAGINLTLDILAKEGEGTGVFADSTRIGEVNATAIPYANLSLSASASANIGIAKGGITGTLNLVQATIPVNAVLNWGLVDNDGLALVVKATVTVDLVMTFLSGSIRVWVDLFRPSWCSCGSWCPGYPCGGWASVVNETLASFAGYVSNTRMYSLSQSLTLQ